VKLTNGQILLIEDKGRKDEKDDAVVITGSTVAPGGSGAGGVPWHAAVPAQGRWTGMFVTTMTDAQSRTTRRPAEHNRSSPTVPAGSEPAGAGPDRDDATEPREALSEPPNAGTAHPRRAAPGTSPSRSRRMAG
jgi:hypothetical protein